MQPLMLMVVAAFVSMLLGGVIGLVGLLLMKAAGTVESDAIQRDAKVWMQLSTVACGAALFIVAQINNKVWNEDAQFGSLHWGLVAAYAAVVVAMAIASRWVLRDLRMRRCLLVYCGCLMITVVPIALFGG